MLTHIFWWEGASWLVKSFWNQTLDSKIKKQGSWFKNVEQGKVSVNFIILHLFLVIGQVLVFLQIEVDVLIDLIIDLILLIPFSYL